MIKTHINPHQLVDRLERKYQKKTRLQKYKSFADYWQNVFHVRDMPTHRPQDESPGILDYEYTDKY